MAENFVVLRSWIYGDGPIFYQMHELRDISKPRTKRRYAIVAQHPEDGEIKMEEIKSKEIRDIILEKGTLIEDHRQEYGQA